MPRRPLHQKHLQELSDAASTWVNIDAVIAEISTNSASFAARHFSGGRILFTRQIAICFIQILLIIHLSACLKHMPSDPGCHGQLQLPICRPWAGSTCPLDTLIQLEKVQQIRKMRRPARQRQQQQPEPKDAEAERGSGEEDAGEEEGVAACDVCGVENARVTIACATCARLFHLSCLTPPLRRRPALADSWTCSGCAESGETSRRQAEGAEETLITEKERGGSRKRGAGGDTKRQEKKPTLEDLTASGSESEEASGARKKRRTSTRTAKSVKVTREAGIVGDMGVVKRGDAPPSSTDKRKESDDFVDPASLPRLKSPARGKAPLKNAKKKPTAAATGKKASQPTVRASAGRSLASRKAAVFDDDEQESVDDDDDSDFVDDDGDDDDDDDSASLSDEDYTAPNARQQRQRQSPASKQKRRASPAPKRTPSPKARASPIPRQPATAPRDTGSQNGSDVDSLDIPVSMQAPAGDNEDGFEVEDEYVGPSYFIEYAPNARAKVSHAGHIEYFSPASCSQRVSLCCDVDNSVRAVSRSCQRVRFALACTSATPFSA